MRGPAIVVTALCLVACKSDVKVEPPPVAAVPTPATGVVLLAAGKAPLLPRVYRPTRGQTFAITINVTQRLASGGPSGDAQTLKDTRLPPTTVTFGATVTATPPEGGYTAALEVTGVVVGDSDPPALAASIRQEVAQVVGVTGTMMVDARGSPPTVHLVLTGAGSSILGPLVASLENTLRSMILPLPAAPVGVGARWSLDDTSEPFGTRAAPVQVHSEYTLAKVAGSQLDVRAALSHHAGASSAPLPVGGAGEIKVSSFAGAGTRLGSYDLAGLGAEKVDGVVRYRISGTLPQDGNAIAVDLTTTTTLEVRLAR
jgi:hypothetical protein